MIETAKPDLNVDQLMSRIREEAQRRRALASLGSLNGAADLLKVPGESVPELPTLYARAGTEPNTQRLTQLLNEAQEKNAVSSLIPRFLRGLFRRQGSFNKRIVEMLKLVTKSNLDLYHRHRETIAYLEAQNYWLRSLVEARSANRLWLDGASAVLNRLHSESCRIGEFVGQLESKVDALGNRADKTEIRFRRTEQDIDETGKKLDRVQPTIDSLKEWAQTTETNIAQNSQAVERLGETLKKTAENLTNLQTEFTDSASKIGQTETDLREARERLSQAEQRLPHIEGALAEHSNGLREIHDRWNADQSRWGQADDRFHAHDGVLQGLRQEQDRLGGHIDRTAAGLDTLQGLVRQFSEKQAQITHELAQFLDTVRSVEGKISVVGDDAQNSRERLNGLLGHVDEQTTTVASLGPALGRLEDSIKHITTNVESLDQRQSADGAFLKAQLSWHTGVLQSLGKSSNSPDGAANTDSALEVERHAYDAYYLAFENRFRGSRHQIKQSVAVYVPFVETTGASKAEGAILDIGCGRGEWLETLRDNGYEKIAGVDSNTAMVEECLERSLNATLQDGIAHLKSLPEASLIAVTAFHLIEHLPFDVLMELFAASHRALQPGGIVIFETPNPRNILVGASDFYRDLTHRNPVHPDTAAFTLDSIGFHQTTCYFMADSPHGRTAIPQRDYHFNELHDYVTVPRDYSVVARKM